MDTFRYGLALVLLLVLPPLLLYWFLIHPFHRFWRRIGLGRSYLIIATPILTTALLIYRARRPLLAIDFGTHPILIALGGACIVLSNRVRRGISRAMTQRVIAGIPELAPDRHPVPLITEGLHARIRHPRYVQVLLAMLGYALVANYLAPYVTVAAWVVAVLAIVPLEERELAARFGRQYEEYRRRVPRFIPRKSGPTRAGGNSL
ncbi:MAG TPA: isoprenylcysteine carboxylmethyltransferase family protein [Candidatus Udaeobacter sp.]|nr:isoprenylcysteine carboxylmethyltransferase family protein [Candidatus Udaeobacter sp.]